MISAVEGLREGMVSECCCMDSNVFDCTIIVCSRCFILFVFMANLWSLNCRFLKEGKLCELEGRIIPVYESGQVMVSESCSIDAKVSVYTINYCLLTIYFSP